MVRMPGPSWSQKRWMSKIRPVIWWGADAPAASCLFVVTVHDVEVLGLRLEHAEAAVVLTREHHYLMPATLASLAHSIGSNRFG